MTHKPKRYHPFSIIMDIWDYLKSAFIPALFLFVLNLDSDSFIWKYGRYAFIVITGCSFAYFILKWFTRKFELSNHAFHLYQGIFNKEEQTIPFQRVQNTNRKTSAAHRLFHMTSLRFETAMSGENATVVFKAINKKQAAEIEGLIENATAGDSVFSNDISETAVEEWEEADRMVHFTPTLRDTIRASFTSFSFLVLIPILFTIYANIDDLFDIEEQTTGIIHALLKTWWITSIVIVVAITLSMLIGISRIYFKYGKYEISSDNDRIYITQGVLNEASFSIAKINVQAINIEQSLVKRLLGIVEIKLVSAGDLNTNDDELEISSLYPFLKKAHAHAILQEILPDYQLTEQTNRLPRQALLLNLSKGFLFYLIPVIAVLYFKPTFWGMTQTWWVIVLTLLFIIIHIGIVLNYKQSGYIMNHTFIQIKKGAFGTSLFVSRRDKISEVSISRSILQQKLGLATLKIINRSRPIKHTAIEHVPLNAVGDFHYWYRQRTNEVLLEEHETSIKTTSQF